MDLIRQSLSGGARQIEIVKRERGDPHAGGVETAIIAHVNRDLVDAQWWPQRVDDVALPWTYNDSTTTPAVVANVQAQGDGSTLGCRITIDGVVKVERITNTPSAYTYCLDKSG